MYLQEKLCLRGEAGTQLNEDKRWHKAGENRKQASSGSTPRHTTTQTGRQDTHPDGGDPDGHRSVTAADNRQGGGGVGRQQPQGGAPSVSQTRRDTEPQ